MKQIVEYLLSKSKAKDNEESIINGFRNIVSTENEKDSKELNDFIDILEKFISFEYIESVYDLLNELIEDGYETWFSIGNIKDNTNISSKSIYLVKVTPELGMMIIYNIPKAKCLIMLVNDKETTVHTTNEVNSDTLLKRIKNSDNQLYTQTYSFDNKSSNVSKFNEQINWIK